MWTVLEPELNLNCVPSYLNRLTLVGASCVDIGPLLAAVSLWS